MNESIAILCAGGPAPGINTVISTVTKVFLKKGYRVLGINGGYKSLLADEPDFSELNFEKADLIYSKGGSALKMSRFKPRDDEFKADFFINNNVKLLVTIGGDDTASTANRLSKYLRNNNIKVANIHVPKTIDNDLPLPGGMPTFGYSSAMEEGVKLTTTLYEDARTSGLWFVVSAMGREAGHLAFGIGTACHLPMIIIPEMFNKTQITFDKITKLIVSSMIKRQILGINYGIASVSEGVFHFMTDEDIVNTGINFTYDEHGHPELGNVSKSHVFNMLTQHELKKNGIQIKSRPNEMGYELRCCRPIAYDLSYTTRLGIGVLELFEQGHTGCIVTTNSNGDVAPLFLKDIEDAKTGKIKPRLVDIDSQKVMSTYMNNCHYITEDDYEAASKLVKNPEDYDFLKILNWK
ncbi:MAG: 6-phosphofructokinase [Bacteroidetes bacterium]|nr:6-phosphofructokinase [Bacteroidota bacterium]